MHFKVGRKYQHNGGRTLRIVGSAFTYYHGPCLVGEEESGRLVPVGSDEDNAENYVEIGEALEPTEAIIATDRQADTSENVAPDQRTFLAIPDEVLELAKGLPEVPLARVSPVNFVDMDIWPPDFMRIDQGDDYIATSLRQSPELKPGDILTLWEYTPDNGRTGREKTVEVTHILKRINTSALSYNVGELTYVVIITFKPTGVERLQDQGGGQ